MAIKLYLDLEYPFVAYKSNVVKRDIKNGVINDAELEKSFLGGQ